MSDKIEQIQLLFQVRNARKRGPVSSDQYNDTIEELSADLTEINSQWNNRLVPLTDSIPDGTVDSTVDAYANGLDGGNLYADQDATTTSNSLYYNSSSSRPNTILEQFASFYTTMNEIRDDLENQVSNTSLTAAQIPITDSAGLYDANNVESALAEIMNTANALELLTFGSVGESIIPTTDNAYDIGSTTKRWRSIYASPSSFHVKTTAAEGGGTARDFSLGVSSTDGAFTLDESGTVILRVPPLGSVQIPELAAAPTQVTGFGTIYTLTADSKLYFKDSSGVVTDLGSGLTESNILNLGADSDNNEAGSQINFQVDGSTHWRVDSTGILNSISSNAVVRSGNGSVSAPGLSFVNDTDVGLFLGTSPTRLGVSVAGSEAISIGTSGKVGIGINSPDELLHIYEGSAGSVTADTSSNIVIESDNAENYIQFLSVNTAQQGILFGDVDDIYVGSIFYDHSTNALSLRANANTRLIIDSSGNVAVGSVSPSQKFEVAPNTDVQAIIGRAKVGYNGADSDQAMFAHYDHMSATDFALAQSAAGTTVLNAVTGRNVDFRVNDSTKWYIDGTSGDFTAGGTFQILADNNSSDASAPGYSFVGNLDTGVFQSAANVVGISSGGTEILTLQEWNSTNTDIDGLLPGSDSGSLLQPKNLSHLTIGLKENQTTDGFSILSGGGNYSSDTTYDTVCLWVQADGKVGIGTSSLNGVLDVYPDTDNVAEIGRAKIGYIGTSDLAGFSHYDNATATDFAIGQNSAGVTTINAPTDATVNLSINNDMKWMVGSAGDFLTSGTYQIFADDSSSDASAPAYSFSGDVDTGIYQHAADQVGVSVGGDCDLLVTTSGTFISDSGPTRLTINNTGVSTTVPLTIEGSSDTEQLIVKANSSQSNSNPLIQMQDSGGTILSSIHSDNNTNLFVGYLAGNANVVNGTDGTRNLFVGYSAGRLNVDGLGNVAIGVQANEVNISGDYNVALGYQALVKNTASSNIGIGTFSLFNNTSGAFNYAIGRSAMFTNQIGARNLAIGYASLFTATGSDNTAIGYESSYDITSGTTNITLGNQTCRYNQTGSSNVIIGFEAGKGVTGNSYSNNTVIGHQAGTGITTGGNNVLLGYKAGDNLTTGNQNIIIGYDIDAAAADTVSGLNIGDILYGNLNTGYVGIGIDTPITLLHLSDPSPKITLTDESTGADAQINADLSGGGFRISADLNNEVAGSYVALNVDGSDKLTVKDTGKVGIGIDTPDELLHIYEGSAGSVTADTNSNLVLESDNAENNFQFLSPNTASQGILFGDVDDINIGQIRYDHSTDALKFVTNNSTRAIIDSGGKTGIGTSSPAARLEVQTASDEGTEAVQIDQNDADKAFIDFAGTSAASAANNISTWTTGNSIQGFIRVEINGSDYWIPFYDAPTS